MPAKISLVGMVFGKLTVLADAESHRSKSGNLRRRSLCRCACGTERVFDNGCLRDRHTKSCGCWEREHPGRLRHGHSSGGKVSGTYNSWAAMLVRCTNPNDPNYPDYGGRGITVCERWEVFDNFLSDMGERPFGLTLHRIENDGNYEPGNCKWATNKEQGRSKRSNRIETVGGITDALVSLVEHFKCNYQLVNARLQNGWPVEAAFFAPKFTHHKKWVA